MLHSLYIYEDMKVVFYKQEHNVTTYSNDPLFSLYKRVGSFCNLLEQFTLVLVEEYGSFREA